MTTAHPEDMTWQDLIGRLERDLEERDRSGDPIRRDNDAWEELVRRIRDYARMLVRWSPNSSLEDAQDLTQDILLRFQTKQGLEQFRKVRSPTMYFIRVVRNAAIDATRRHRRRERSLKQFWEEVLSPTALESTDETTKATYGGDDGLDRLRVVLKNLTEEEQHLLKLRFWDDLSVAEIANRLRLSYSAVGVRFFRLFGRLRLELKGDSEDTGK